MPATKRLVLDLPEEVADTIEAHVTSGEYADAAHMVVAGVGSLPGADYAGLGELDEDSPEWKAIIAECDEAGRRIDAGLERTYSVDEVFDELKLRMRARVAQRLSI